MTRWTHWAAALALGCSIALSAAAQTSGQTEEVRARVQTSPSDTGILIDRGEADGLAVGDRVEFRERGGALETGTIVELRERSAVVRPDDVAFQPRAGVRATIDVPAARFEAPTEEPTLVPVPEPSVDPETAPEAEGAGAEVEADPKSKWSNADEDWTFDMPLLAEVGAIEPHRRPRSFSGRTYLSFDGILDSEDSRGDVFLRAGGTLRGENPFGRGGRLLLDGEWNLREAVYPDEPLESDRTFRLDRLSYTSGDHRHAWNSWQVGRFLSADMPEFGVLDGAAWKWRRENGSSYGASVGFLPEPDKDQQSLEDFQIAAWYRWVRDEKGDLAITTGFQKTWHNGTRDRDLLVSRLEYLPEEGWNVFGTAWIDLYGVGDDVKSSGPALTYMVLDAQRDLGPTAGIDLEYRHQEYPELLRDEFPPGVDAASLDDAHVDRLSATAWRWLRPKSATESGIRSWGRVAAWTDEEDSGNDLSLGVEFHDLVRRGSRLDLTGFTTAGKFTDVQGGRVRYAENHGTVGWSVQYEIRLNDIIGFENDADDLVQHRIRGSYDLRRSKGMTFSAAVEGQFQDREEQYFLGLFLQRSF